MAAVTRQPFAPLDGARLQSLTSLKNRQNASPAPATAGKRKAELLDTDDFENVDPLLFAKRAKGSGSPSKDALKPSSAFVLTKASAPSHDARPAVTSPSKAPSATPRRTLQPKSPFSRLSTNVTKSSPNSAPAGRSPTRGKRSGIFSSRRRTAGSYSRVDPPSFNLGAPAPFSLDAALKGTIPSYETRPKPPPAASRGPEALPGTLDGADLKASWFFDIHEDTPEQEMTNLLQHSTCVLDISSDEESETKARRERAEGRDKENIPPADDVSQTSARRAPRLGADDMVVEKQRVALGEMDTADFFAAGCDESSVIMVPADEEQAPQQNEQQSEQQPEQPRREPIVDEFEFAPELKAVEPAPEMQDVDVLMSKGGDDSGKAAVLQPIEGTGESFDLWESGSAKDDAEVAAEPAPEAAAAEPEAPAEATLQAAVEQS